ncbi:peptidase M48-like protein [Edaphobacter aggregans]|uniref:Peptidase M48-like protein n=1 Tax=Edaphobacter aggregans TaxID=570835 RepID=A0A428MFB9_9BACT|nr:M48 family metalloprotease [Edaphobacter aggregans]RSL15542.1 peptidase M48-like protein [Edaphobacter aggregans]
MRNVARFSLAASIALSTILSYAQATQPSSTQPTNPQAASPDNQQTTEPSVQPTDTPPPPRNSKASKSTAPADSKTSNTTKPTATDTKAPDTTTSTTTDTKTPDTTKPTTVDADSKAPDTVKADSKTTDSKATDTASKKADSLPSPGEHLDPHIKPGSEDDVNAVGTRNIGGRGIGNWYSTDWEIRNGKSYSMEIEKSAHLVTDPVIVEYVNRIGQNIVKNSDCKVPFTIKVLDSDEINAMALPGGFFYVNSGLILAADEEAELAGVMAHETAHVCAHHAARQMTKMNYVQIGSIPLIIFTQGTWTGYGIYEATQLAIPITFLKFSRIDEAEADWLGLQYMYKAGYDPQAFIQFFEKIDALEKHKPGTLSKVFADHPQTPDRIAHSEDEIATIMPAKPDYIVTTSEFDDVKARLARIENKRKLNDKGNGNKPTLRRTSSGSGNNDPNNPNNGNGSSTTDDRPTLGRRN